MANTLPTDKEAIKFLRQFYRMKGYTKTKSVSNSSHSGKEIRFSTSNEVEASDVTRAMKKLGFTHGKPFGKHGKLVIPYYGEKQVKTFLKIVKPKAKVAKNNPS